MSSDEPSFLYVVCNKPFYKPAKNQTGSHKFPKIMAKKRSRGRDSMRWSSGGPWLLNNESKVWRNYTENTSFDF